MTREIMEGALAQAKQARTLILERMLEALPQARTELAPHDRGSKTSIGR